MFRTPDPHRLALHNEAQAVADELRAAFASLRASTDKEGPRMNYDACAAGIGLDDTANPPEWLVDVLSALTSE